LRNPLAPVRNAAALLHRANSDAKTRDWATSVIERQVHSMSLLLDDLLDISRITRNALALNKEPVQLAAIIESAVEIARPLINSKAHKLTVSVPNDLTVEVDLLRISQVTANLLTNAAKYTDAHGSIELCVEAQQRDLHIIVRDNGIGLAPESLAEVFLMFSQVRSSLERSEGGLGIGLALVKGLVQLHGGTVTARSEGLGRGSEFRVILPDCIVYANEKIDSLTQTPHASNSRRILIADDNEDGRESLALLLSLSGHSVTCAPDGEEGLRELRANPFDIALIDIGMPKMNGLELARAARDEAWRSATILIAMSGWGQESDREASIIAGFDAHLTKPVSPDVLDQLLRSSTPMELLRAPTVP
jgi:CheY-like chemotaxis protein/two-component sensor histidine kinase